MTSDNFSFYDLHCKKDEAISLNDKPLKLVEQFLYLGSNISSMESKGNIHINWLSTILKSDLSDTIKWESFQAVTMSVQSYICIASTKR